jgi:hypothetical protein
LLPVTAPVPSLSAVTPSGARLVVLTSDVPMSAEVIDPSTMFSPVTVIAA